MESAAMVLNKISRTHLECTICHERYQTPKILECLHSFCKNCLLTYKENVTKDSNTIKCPICRKESKLTSDGIEGLRTNFHLMGMVEDFTLQEKLTQRKGLRLPCELCSYQKEADSRCMDCPFFLCANCQDVHRRIAATANHDILALDTLRSGTVSLRGKVKDDPPCEKHRGEKKRFYCESCEELICRDCTVVDHRESEHKFTTIDEAASRIKQITKELIVKVEEGWSALKETQLELTKMASDLHTSGSLAQKQVNDQFAKEGSKIAQREADIQTDISRREKLRQKTFRINGILFSRPPSEESKSTKTSATGEENRQKYSATVEEKFKAIDTTLVSLGKNIELFLKTNQEMHTIVENLKEEARKEATGDKYKVANGEDKLLSQIRSTYDVRLQAIREVSKITSTQIERFRHALDIASDVVKSASNVDFLSIHSVIDGDLRALLQESSPNLHPGYPKIEFKSSDNTGLGEVVVGATWKWTRDIGLQSTQSYSNHHSLCISTFINNEILVVTTAEIHMYNKSGSLSRRMYGSGGGVATCTFPDGSATIARGQQVCLYAPNSPSPTSTFNLPSTIKKDDSQISLGSPVSIGHYGDKQIAVGYKDWQGILIHGLPSGEVIRQLPVSIKPDFMTSTSKGRILVGARNPASLEGLDSSGDTALTIHPTTEGCSDGKQVICVGICRDKRDTIYVAVTPEGDSQVHVHQYSPHGSFLDCFTVHNDPPQPIVGIAVTGDDNLVVAAQRKLKLFEREI